MGKKSSTSTKKTDQSSTKDDKTSTKPEKPLDSNSTKLNKSSKSNKKAKHNKKLPRTKKQKILLITLIIIVVLLIGALIFLLIMLNKKHEASKIAPAEFTEPIYSILTGEEISDESLNSSPTFCVQIPNGNDGARPQAGLTQAGVVFEAIAEAGITRFAAVFQNPTTGVIGPIRSLRPYYLDWDTPFDCTVVHAGGSDEAIRAINAGGQRNLDESLEYMWHETNSGRRWNNLFTSPSDLAKFNSDHDYRTSNVIAFPRQTPEEAEAFVATQRITVCEDGMEPAQDDCVSAEEFESMNLANAVSHVSMRIGNIAMFNINYDYDAESNRYLRSYANGEQHMVYECPASLEQPNTTTECGELIQVAPKAVAAMIVQEGRMADGYHENITTLSSGDAYIFQNGTVIEGSWTKSAQNKQIIFRDNEDNEIKFTPGQLWITAVPQYGGVTWE